MKKISSMVVLVIIIVFLSGCQKATNEPINPTTSLGVVEAKKKAEEDLAIAKAKVLWQEAINNGADLSKGPCLANDLMPDWVADIAHYPRQPIDNQPENQCSAFREGRAHHFVELDEQGQVIKVY